MPNKEMEPADRSKTTEEASDKGKPAAGTGDKSKGDADKPAAFNQGMPWWVPAGVAVAVLVYFGVLHYQMFELAADPHDERVWERRWMLFVSLEAIALAAAGAMLGVQIQRGRVVSAEQRASKAEDAVIVAGQDARKANAKADKLQAKVAAYIAVLENEAASHAQPGDDAFGTEMANASAEAARRLLRPD